MASLLTEMPNVLDVREVMFTNLLLLGFDPAASEEKFKIHFSRDMFALINKKGMEVVMHFLFTKLDSHLAYEEFRDCWPVYDKKLEQQFRKTCSNWIARIAKEAPESRLPRLSASLLLSPGGDKFYLFLLRFSSHVLKTVCLREAKSEEREVFIPSFLTSPECLQPSMRDVAISAMKSHIVRHTDRVVQRLQLASALHEEWKANTCKLISEYRACSKEQRELTKRLASLQEQQKQKALTGTPKRLQPSSAADDKVHSLTNEVAVSKRKSRMKKVRDMWKAIESFDEKSTHQREVVDSILQGDANKYTFDAKDVIFQIPDLLLQEFEALMREGKVGNTYEAGKLNLISLIQVWNCALEVLKTHILSGGGVPSFEREGAYMAGELQAHRAHLAAAQNLRASLLEFHASLEESIRETEARLQELRKASSSQCGLDQQQAGEHQIAPLLQIPPITLPSLGLELMPPSPEKSLVTSPGEGRGWKVPAATPLSFLDDSVSTPEAVHNISKSVQLASQRNANPVSKSSFIPISKASMPSTLAHDPTTSTIGGDYLSIFDDSPGSLTKATYTQSPKATTTTGTTEKRKTQRPLKPTTDARREGSSKKQSQKPTTVRDLNQKQRTRARKALGGANTEHATVANLPSSLAVSLHQHSLPSTPLSESKPGRTVSTQQQTPMARPKDAGSTTVRTPLLESMPRAHDILADQIAAAVASPSEGEVEGSSLHTPEGMLHSLVDPVSAMGRDAFVSKDKIPRTPLSKPAYQKHAMKTRLSPLIQSPATPQQPEVSKHFPETELLVQFQQHLPSDQLFSANATPAREQLPSSFSVTPSPGVTKGMPPVSIPSQSMSTLEEPSAIQPPSQPAVSRTLSETATEESPHDLHSHGMSPASKSPAHSEHQEEMQQSTASASLTQESTHHLDMLTTATLTVPISPRSALTTAVSPTLVSLRSTVASHPIQSPPSSIPVSTPHSRTAPVALTSVRKVAFEQSQVAVTARAYTTPTQSPSLFTTVQPPTPFQHADFDLDSSVDNELSGGAESDSDQTQGTGSGEESLLVDLEAAKEMSVTQGDLLSLEEPPFQGSTDLQPSEVTTANLLSFHTPVPPKSTPTSSPLVIRTEENLIELETPLRAALSTMNQDQNLLNLSAAPLSNLPQRGHQTSENLTHGSEASHATPHAQEGSLQNTWLTGAGSESDMFEDGSPFLVAPSPMQSMSSHEGSLDHSSLS